MSSARQPEVTTDCPLPTRFSELRQSRIKSLRSPTDGFSTPWTPLGTIFAPTALEASAISVTLAEPPVTAETLPTRPSPLTTGSLTLTPSPEPTSIITSAYQTVGERAITRPVTGV